MGFKRWKISEIDKKIAGELAEECNIEPFLALIAYSRGYTDPFLIDEFLSRDVPDFDPFIFPDMEVAAKRVNNAVQSGEKILIYGDYDCDGVTSTALLYLFLKSMGADVSYYIPSRSKEGYGMNCESIEKLSKEGINLIITVDNGISAITEIDYANKLGIDIVVTDHHLPKSELPNAVAVVDPHREDSSMEFKEFAGVGVAFALALAISGSSPATMLSRYSDLVALGTVADVMPLKHENRKLVWYGLRKINQDCSKGLKALLGVSGAKFGEITAGTLAFSAAPRINAAGRLGDASRAVELLISHNFASATEIAVELDDENFKRQKIEQEITLA
ncbi:MAG: DHH family phosphoesterase, partial [Acutalibacteraceae bacterium]|nr:DHH family phosphoesterase [Acutalibacteraceae bacterium]